MWPIWWKQTMIYLSKDVSTWMPKGITTFWRIKFKNLQFTISLKRSGHIPKYPIHLWKISESKKKQLKKILKCRHQNIWWHQDLMMLTVKNIILKPEISKHLQLIQWKFPWQYGVVMSAISSHPWLYHLVKWFCDWKMFILRYSETNIKGYKILVCRHWPDGISADLLQIINLLCLNRLKQTNPFLNNGVQIGTVPVIDLRIQLPRMQCLSLGLRLALGYSWTIPTTTGLAHSRFTKWMRRKKAVVQYTRKTERWTNLSRRERIPTEVEGSCSCSKAPEHK